MIVSLALVLPFLTPAALAQDAYLVSDFKPGPNPSYATVEGEVGGFLVVLADGPLGYELYRTDGTPGGTTLIRDLDPGPGSGAWRPTAIAGGQLYFPGRGSEGEELWKTDATDPGTVLVRDIRPGPLGSSPGGMTELNGEVYFSADDGVVGRELWKSDGTSAGTRIVLDLHPTSSANPFNLTVAGGELYFTANYGNVKRGLFKTDGTSAGTVLLKDLSFSLPAVDFAEVGGQLFFLLYSSARQELWKSDGTVGGTVFVKDLGTPVGPWIADELTEVNGQVFFRANSELWSSDGTSAGTAPVLPGLMQGVFGLTDLSGTLLFEADDGGTFGAELWRSDGTAAGTVLVKDIRPGFPSSFIAAITAFEGEVYFQAGDSIRPGIELWKSDGTTAGTVLVADVSSTGSSNPGSFWGTCGRLFFQASDAPTGRELWAIDTAYEFYCTAKTNSCGTLPQLTASGIPSATASSGFTVRASNAKAGKAGLFLYSDQGRASAPFEGGTLCVGTPLKRSVPVVDTTGTGACDGALSIDMNAFASGALGGNPLGALSVPGTVIDGQFWARDTVAGSLLSDAIEYSVCP